MIRGLFLQGFKISQRAYQIYYLDTAFKVFR